ncbi:MAG: fimbrillin family protein [Parabacteroides sp.]
MNRLNLFIPAAFPFLVVFSNFVSMSDIKRIGGGESLSVNHLVSLWTKRFFASSDSFFYLPIGVACFFFAVGLCSCGDDDFVEPTSNVSELTVSVVANEPVTKDIITAGFLDDKSEIGVAMYNDDLGSESGVSYHYHNVKFTAAGTAENQVWTPEQPIFLGETVGTAYAYYPYNEEVTNVEEIPVTTVGQTDYLYAKQENLSNTATNATFPMNHGLAVISMKVVRGSYPGAGSLTKAEVRGPGICTAGKLNAKTGELHSFEGKAEPVAVNTAFTIDTEGDVVDVIVVPNGETASFHITFTIDGVEYTTTTTEIKLEAGCRYHYTVTANERQMVLSAVTIGDWVYNDAGDRMIMVGGYSITLAGDLAGLAFNSVVNESTVTIEARPKTAFWVPVSITASEGVTMTQELAMDGLITLNLSEFTADVVVTFVGYKVEIVQSYTDCVISAPSINAEKVISFTAAPINYFWVPNISMIGSGNLAQEIASDGKVSVSLKNVSSDVKINIDGYSIAYTGNFSKYVLQEEISNSKVVTITGAIDPTVADGSSFVARSVSIDGSAEMSFDLSTGLTIELSNVSSPITLNLDGYTITIKSNVSTSNIKNTGYFDALGWVVKSPYELGTLDYWLPYASHTGSSSSLTTNTISDSQFTVSL